MTSKQIKQFQHKIWENYRKNKRNFSWRNTKNPYRILVSEVMLQQTQVSRVVPKYKTFLKVFPNFQALASASTIEVLRMWQGFGYNRRALALQKTARIVLKEYRGIVPCDFEKLLSLPGIGESTAGAVMAFACNKPAVFIETNIRRVFIHFFFRNKSGITDKEIKKLVGKTLDYQNPREWYYALMDYGAMLATKVPNPNRKSAHYTTQPKFKGSDREIRGKLLTQFLERKSIKQGGLDKRTMGILHQLKKEGLIL